MARSKPYTLPNDTEVHADVSIGTPEGAQGFGLAVNLLVKGSFEASDRSALEEIAHEAHQKCPYSKATCVVLFAHPVATISRLRFPSQPTECLVVER